MCTILIVIIVKIISLRSFLFECVLYNHSFKPNPNTVTNFSKFFKGSNAYAEYVVVDALRGVYCLPDNVTLKDAASIWQRSRPVTEPETIGNEGSGVVLTSGGGLYANSCVGSNVGFTCNVKGKLIKNNFYSFIPLLMCSL